MVARDSELGAPVLSRTAVAYLSSLAVLLALIAIRVLLADKVPLLDNTEARYAEFARKMVETGDWLVPQYDYGVPYLGKPPLAFWLPALSIALLGTAEIAARLPFLLASGVFGFAFYRWMRPLLGAADAMAGVVVLLASPIVFVCSGAVMTDALLAACSSGALMCFWARMQGAGRIVEDLLYLLVGAGLLIKGPLVLVLILVPIIGWSFTCARPADVWARFAWIRGAIIVACVALPWYVLAEQRNPGFLGYFIGGEHFGRFLVPGWSGDRYGWVHDEPIGTVWLYFLLGTVPWSPIVAFRALTRRREMRRRWRERRALLLFAIWWAATPLVLFTFTANVTVPYVLPAVPGAVLASVVWLARDAKVPPGAGFSAAVARLSSISAAAIVVFVLVLIRLESSVMASAQKAVVQAVYAHHPLTSPILYWRHRYHSAEYYSAGSARPAQDADVIRALLGAKRDFSLVIDRSRIADLPTDVRDALRVETEIGSFDVLSPAS